MPNKITKQNKNNWERNHKEHYYNFMQFQYKPLQNLGEKDPHG